MLSNEVKTIIGVPEYYVDEYNSTPIQNFWCLIESLLKVFNPRIICEIGSERGITTKLLTRYARENQAIVHSVDPQVSHDLDESSELKLFAMGSLEYLKKHAASFYIIDGDHNYYTVSSELQSIENSWDKETPLCILFHDIGWPWAQRDMYYDPDRIPEPHLFTYENALNLESSEFSGRGFASGGVYAMALNHGGPQNGVRTAIENFISVSSIEWECWQIPALYGLGCLWPKSALSPAQLDTMTLLRKSIQQIQPLLSIMEANRLRLYQGLMEHQDDLQKAIAELRFYSRIPVVGHFIRLIGRLMGRNFRY